MVQQFEDAGLSFTGKDESGCRMERWAAENMAEAVIVYSLFELNPVSTSEDDLLCTRASPSLLPLLSSGFGIPLSSLNNLFSEDGSFLRSGYILGPDVYTVKVNPDTVQQFKDAGLSFIGKDESGCCMEFTPSLNLTLFPPGICCYRLETCYVKVDDDGSSEVVLSFEGSSEVVLSFEGSGVSQDGLVLMGKRFDELIRKKKSRRSHTALPFYDSKKKFFASINNDRKCVELIRAVRRLHHSAEAIWSELPWMSSHQCDQSSTPSTGDSVFSDVSKLQAQGECTSTRDGESKEEIVTKTHGRPNGYRKVLKPKEGLAFSEESLLRIALVHPNVCFKIVDIERSLNSYDPDNVPANAIVNIMVKCSCGDSHVSKDYGQFITYPLRPDQNLVTVANEFNLPQKLLEDYNP
ncbi:hypothetical protein MTR67_005275 [Solanum verrucosum]|uniref:LYK3/RLK10-like LysM domain-containing protein n=1 Tax=Solanum verrucosum TaxID=315347 RepID=A0AAF0TFU8_SOLVR|nr:hypothetical protein MTR67_005275 [Solanum verrucosum]